MNRRLSETTDDLSNTGVNGDSTSSLQLPSSIIIMEFQFIDNNTTKDACSRKAIRSHVMKGKNVGRTVRRGRKHAVTQGFFQDVERTNPQDDGAIFPEIAASDGVLVPTNPFAGGEFAYFSFPVQFTPSMRYLVHQCTEKHERDDLRH